jgi:hypothetical protein
MNKEDKLNLKKIVNNYNPIETTEKIRDLKHSEKIRENVTTYLELKNKYKRLSKDQFTNIVQKKCYFLYENYTNIFNKLIKDELNLTILNKFLFILHKIEKGDIDQHEGSVMVGNILKELYIDSALRKDNKRNENKKTERTRKGKNITWNDYKKII